VDGLGVAAKKPRIAKKTYFLGFLSLLAEIPVGVDAKAATPTIGADWFVTSGSGGEPEIGRFSRVWTFEDSDFELSAYTHWSRISFNCVQSASLK
jgi:hypothetical protein